MRCNLIAAVLGLVLGLAAVAQDAKKDLEQMQGAWQMVSMEIEGKKVAEDDLKGFRLQIKGDRASHKGQGDVTEESVLKLDPSKSPKAVDFEVVGGTDKGKTMLAIYKLEADMLTFCVASPGDNQRPKEFASKPGSKIGLIVFKRIKS